MSKTTYKVMAGGFLRWKEGDEFQADLDPDLERRAKERGSIRVVSRGDDKPKTKKEQADG